MQAFSLSKRDSRRFLWAARSPECELLYRVTEIVGVFGGLRYHSPECKHLYQVKEILNVFVVFQHYSPTCELLNQAKEMHDKFEHGSLFA
jgi:hypothetical protein